MVLHIPFGDVVQNQHIQILILIMRLIVSLTVGMVQDYHIRLLIIVLVHQKSNVGMVVLLQVKQTALLKL